MSTSTTPTYSIAAAPTDRASTILDGLVLSGLVSSRADGRRLIVGGGVTLNDVKVTDPARELSTDDVLPGGHIVLRKGKRDYVFLTFNNLVQS